MADLHIPQKGSTMTTTQEHTVVANSQGEGVIAPVVLGLAAVIAGALGTACIGIAGLVWRPWEFGTTYHWEGSESPLGDAIGLSFFAIAAGLLLWLIARGIWIWRSRSSASHTLVVMMPIIAIALVFAAWVALLAPGGSQPTWGL